MPIIEMTPMQQSLWTKFSSGHQNHTFLKQYFSNTHLGPTTQAIITLNFHVFNNSETSMWLLYPKDAFLQELVNN